MDLHGLVKVVERGRYGDLLVKINNDRFTFYWEFGGGDCVATINVPTPSEWGKSKTSRIYNRKLFLTALANEICRLKCNGCRYQINDSSLNILESKSKRGTRAQQGATGDPVRRNRGQRA